MTHVFSGLLVSGHIGKVTTVISSNAPNPDSMDWLRVQGGPIFRIYEFQGALIQLQYQFSAISPNSRLFNIFTFLAAEVDNTPVILDNWYYGKAFIGKSYLLTALLLFSGVRSSSASSHQPRL